MRIEPIIMPQLGEGITDAKISHWLKEPGEQIEAYEALLEVVTDKVTTEIPSLVSGRLVAIFYEADQIVPMGQSIGSIELVEDVSKTNPVIGSKKTHNQPVPKKQNNQVTNKRFSPAVWHLAQTHQVDLGKIKGSGLGGRITRKDVLASLTTATKDQGNESDSRIMSQPDIQSRESRETNNKPEGWVKSHPVSAVRQVIAENMVKSASQIPHAWMMVEVDATNLVRLRETAKENFAKGEGHALSYLGFFIKIIAQVLREQPILNSQWASTHIIEQRDVNISIAVAANDLLYVPVIKQADEKSVKVITKEIARLAEKARNKQLSTEDMAGGTFTVNSTGSYGSIMSQGIINYPQVGILQVESIVKRPMCYQEGIAIRDMVNLCLSLDHRVLDGVQAGKFLARVKELVETIDPQTFSIS